MTPLALVLATALLLGVLHAFDPDHLAAAAAFVARRPSARAAFGFAVRWGLGHSATLLAAGLAMTLFQLVLTPDLEAAAELAVGAMLVGLGLWVLAGLRRRSDTSSSGPAFWVGALHGLAGSAGLLVIVPVALIASPGAVVAYIGIFSLGVTAAMAGYALAIGGLFGKVAGGAGARWYPWLAGAAGSCSLLLGLAWISLTIAARTV